MRIVKKSMMAAALLGAASAAVLAGQSRAMGLFNAGYVQENLVSDDTSKIPADHEDPALINPWGNAFFPAAAFWINDNGTGLSALYDGDGTLVGGGSTALAVIVPPPTGETGPSTPTGIVANTSGVFKLTTPFSGAAAFIFATEDGTISAWNGPVGFSGPAQLEVDNSKAACINGAPGAIYKGLAEGETTAGVFLYATNFACGTVDVFNGTFAQVSPSGGFKDVLIPSGYAPFGIQNILGNLVVTYAKQDAEKHDDDAGPGHGFVDVFDSNGNLIKRLVQRFPLNSPWGIVQAPLNFGPLSGDLLIGNFGDGRINAFNLVSGQFLGTLNDKLNRPVTIEGLWSLVFGGATQSDPGVLYFTSGPNDEADGLFGKLTPQ
jgi:uncharacterized protein (TIGR03118 family)